MQARCSPSEHPARPVLWCGVGWLLADDHQCVADWAPGAAVTRLGGRRVSAFEFVSHAVPLRVSATPTGLEPAVSSLTTRRALHLLCGAMGCSTARAGSNHRPSGCAHLGQRRRRAPPSGDLHAAAVPAGVGAGRPIAGPGPSCRFAGTAAHHGTRHVDRLDARAVGRIRTGDACLEDRCLRPDLATTARCARPANPSATSASRPQCSGRCTAGPVLVVLRTSTRLPPRSLVIGPGIAVCGRQQPPALDSSGHHVGVVLSGSGCVPGHHRQAPCFTPAHGYGPHKRRRVDGPDAGVGAAVENVGLEPTRQRSCKDRPGALPVPLVPM